MHKVKDVVSHKDAVTPEATLTAAEIQSRIDALTNMKGDPELMKMRGQMDSLDNEINTLRMENAANAKILEEGPLDQATLDEITSKWKDCADKSWVGKV